ncbi:S-formylglutathione hydrolase [Acaryochloris thomasi RCC1774]|uniref:S-formylglutathione hydrolase n=1 Tax=Acaryochloris thomasi RCC1774 TaxID=1764569 RepID=A0A2W1JMY1_9CYAN|nr:S-formylglutathione hydrolase [Acaryochloris thomasi]PZD74678.1 S-formylglutathione hydrolase [Acaryochloris thomasi RCC1774]
MSDAICTREYACFGGTVGYYEHPSQTCQTTMRFSVYRPSRRGPVPVLYFLSGLTCTEENFMVKAGAQRYAAEYGLMLVVPDTSPRETNTPGESDAWDLGTGAGFYVNATQAPWQKHYQMYSYVVNELPALIAQSFSIQSSAGICGHSMGGHGALVCGLRNRDRYRSISALAPIAAPMQCPWGKKALTQYLGSDQTTWHDYDASQLVLTHSDERPILIDQGAEDEFLTQGQLLPEVFKKACQQTGQPLTLRMHPGYDHSYYFIATVIGDHIRHHAKALGAV